MNSYALQRKCITKEGTIYAPRPFGLNKVIELISYLKGSEPANVDSFEYQLGISIFVNFLDN